MTAADNSSNTLDLSFRSQLKLALMDERMVRSRQRYPSCPICGQPLRRGDVDMHEVFLTRGDVQMASEELRQAIHRRENCVLVHTECHEKAATKKGKRLCVRQLINFEGYANIQSWLEDMNLGMKGDQPAYELLQLDEIAGGMLW